MQFAHKITNVSGGNKLVTVTEHNGKALVKMTLIPTGKAKQIGMTQKQLECAVKLAHEKHLTEEVTK